MICLLNQFLSIDKTGEYLSNSSRLISLTFLLYSSVLSELFLPSSIRLFGLVDLSKM